MYWFGFCKDDLNKIKELKTWRINSQKYQLKFELKKKVSNDGREGKVGLWIEKAQKFNMFVHMMCIV